MCFTLADIFKEKYPRRRKNILSLSFWARIFPYYFLTITNCDHDRIKYVLRFYGYGF